jgi:hypothetical protein
VQAVFHRAAKLPRNSTLYARSENTLKKRLRAFKGGPSLHPTQGTTPSEQPDKPDKMSISKIRETIQSLNWNRQDATGGTHEENKRTNLPAVLAPHIAAVTALEIPARFVRDIEAKSWALHAAKLVLEKWNANQNVIQFAAA